MILCPEIDMALRLKIYEVLTLCKTLLDNARAVKMERKPCHWEEAGAGIIVLQGRHANFPAWGVQAGRVHVRTEAEASSKRDI